MKSIDKKKTQKLIEKIESGDFDYNVVDSLFMLLRAYSNGYPIFREFSDFVAHNDERNRGMVKSSLEYMYLSIKFAQEYPYKNRNLNISDPFPSWIKKLMIYQIDKINEKILRSNYNYDKTQLTNLINRIFSIIKGKQLVQLIDNKMSIQKYVVIRFLLSFIDIHPTFSQNQVLTNVIEVVKKNGLIISESAFLKNKKKFILNLIILLHHTKYKYGDQQIGYSIIECHGGNDIESKLIQVSGIFNIDDDTTIVFKILTTDLTASDYVDKNILENEEFHISDIIRLPENIDVSELDKIILS